MPKNQWLKLIQCKSYLISILALINQYCTWVIEILTKSAIVLLGEQGISSCVYDYLVLNNINDTNAEYFFGPVLIDWLV